ncbi:hypothetical protein HAX54_017753 [Datura stramonium]|uniref:Calmodulin-binding domain-containing protein n=1 Tax=Datura stramonium TaxID=4076 RepID=A0ABS8S0Z6_DATST|nr:hypothetical protein [Datura stramonium]
MPKSRTTSEFSESSSPPHYRNPTSCSEGKSCESSFDSSDQSRSPRKFSQTLSRTTSMRSVKILINKSSFKSKSGTSKCCKIPDKATCSSTIKDSKFKEHVEFHPDKLEPDRMSKFKSIRAKREFTVDENALLENTQLSPSLDPSVCEQSSAAEDAGDFHVNEAIEYADLAEIDFGEKQNSGTEDAAFFKVNEAIEYADLAEIAFGETSFPEQSYKETLNIMNKYSTQEQGSLLTASNCCSCMARGRSDSKDDSGFSFLLKQGDSVSTSGEDGSSKREFSKVGLSSPPARDRCLIFLVEQNIKHVTASPAISASNIQLEHGDMQEKDGKADPNEDLVRTSGLVGDSKSKNCPPVEVAEPKKQHMNMWSLIRRQAGSRMHLQNLRTNRPVELMMKKITRTVPTNLLQQAPPHKFNLIIQSVTSEPGVDQELIEMSQAAKTARMRRQMQDPQKTLQLKEGDNTKRSEKQLLKEHQNTGAILKMDTSPTIWPRNWKRAQLQMATKIHSLQWASRVHPQPVMQQRKKIAMVEAKECEKTPKPVRGFSLIINDFSETKDDADMQEDHYPSHHGEVSAEMMLSNSYERQLNRSTAALERARKFNPRAPQLLPQAPDQEPEKVDLRHQMTDERKKAEKWMLDYAMQNIVTTLTPARKEDGNVCGSIQAVVPLCKA